MSRVSSSFQRRLNIRWGRRVGNKDGKCVRLRTRAEFLDMITQVVRQDLLDIMLVSCSNLELLQEADLFKGSPVRPAFRANDTTDIWGARPNGYGKLGPSRPFRAPSLKRIAEAKLGNLPGAILPLRASS